MPKRIFWLIFAALAVWLIWMRLRQRQGELAATTPQFAPPRTFEPLTPATPPARQPDSDEALAAAPDSAPPHTFAPPAPPARQPDSDKALIPTPDPAPPAATEPPPHVALATPEVPPPPIGATDDRAAETVQAGDDIEEEISGYCMRCKTKRPIQNARRETTESGRPAARGVCPVCGANMFTFLATNGDV